MSELQTHVYIATSLDGFIATKSNGLEWLDRVKAEGEDYGYAQFMASVDAIVMGRNTYDIVRGFGEWPFQGKKVIVVTHRPLTPVQDEQATSAPLRSILSCLEAQGVRKIYLDGGHLIRSGLSGGLVDQITLSIIPIILGDGIPLFGRIGAEIPLESLSAKRFPSGLVQLVYRVQKS